MSSYKFYKQIEEEFEFLMPDRKNGLVIFHLYQKNQNGDLDSTFSEEEIIRSIKAIWNIKTEQKEQFNHTIKFLQKYYLWRDEENREYRFKPFAIQICELFNELLLETFTPTEIEEDFKYILNTLDQNKNDFEKWYRLTFETYKDKVNSQISALDRQMSKAVDSFRSKIVNEESYDILALKDIVDNLLEIGRKAEELNAAFSGSHEINNSLGQLLTDPNNATHSTKIKQVRLFFKEIRENLKIISQKIDRVKPKLNEYIRDINRQDFFKKFKLFTKVLLNQSSLIDNELNLPKWLPKGDIFSLNTSKFIIVKDNWNAENAYNYRISKVIKLDVDKEKTKERLEEVKKRYAAQNRIKLYLSELDLRFNKNIDIDFSTYFFEVLERERGNLSIASQFAFYAMNKYHRNNEYGVSIIEERVINHIYPNLSVWKTIIYKKI